MTRPPSDTDALAPTTPTSATATDGAKTKRDSSPLRPSDRVGDRYQLEGLLGKGGMGAVYRARDEALGGQPVALKLVAGDVTGDPIELKRLRDEVVLAQKVTHPSVCRTYDLEEIDGLWLIKMEVVEGESLAHRLKRVGKLPITEVERIATWITRGLAAAHRQGVIHRDLKPQNVMIERESNRIVLMDFGIARRANARNSNIEIMGTPDYMAPEQARGEAIDGRADLYSLGCVIYEMLTGSRPYATKTAVAAALENLDEPPPDPRLKRPDTPRYLATIVRALLEKDPAKRPPDAAAVVAMAARRPLRMWLLAGGVVAVAGIAAVLAWRLAAKPEHVAPWFPQLVEVQPRVDENLGELSISQDGKRISFDSDRDQRNATFRIYVGPIDSNEATAISPAALPMLSAGFAGSDAIYAEDDLEQTSYRVPIGGGEPQKLGGKGLPAPCGAGLMVQIYEDDGTSRFVVRMPNQPERVVVELRPPRVNVGTWHCSPDATRFVYAVMTSGSILTPHSDLWEVALAGGEPHQLTTDGARNEDPSFTPEGSIVFSSMRGGTMNIWELPVGGGAARQITHGSGDDLEANVTPDGKRLVFAVDSTTSVIRSYGDAPSQRITNAHEFYSSPVVTPDGRELLGITARNDAITAVSIADGGLRTVVKRSASAAAATLAVTPDGATLAFSVGAKPSEIYVMPAAGGTAKRIAQLDGDVRILQMGGDGALHAELQAPARQEAWRIPLDGSPPAREGGDEAGFILPSASGWTLVLGPAPPRRPRPAKLIPKGAAPGDKRIVELTVALADWSRDGNVLAYFDGTKVHRYEVTTGGDRVLATPSDTQPWIAIAPDGKTVYVFALEGFVRRTIITNFADRPR